MKKRKKAAEAIFIIVLAVCISSGCKDMGKEKPGNNMAENREELTLAGDPGEADAGFSGDIHTDIVTRHAFPSLERMEEKDQDKYVNSLQVIKKIEKTGLDTSSFLYPELNLQKLEQNIQVMGADSADGLEKAVFTGTSSDELQEAVNANKGAIIDIRSDRIEVTGTVSLADHTYIKGNGAELACNGVGCVFTGEDVSGVSITGLHISGNADYGIYMTGSSNIRITDCTIEGMKQKPICILGNASGLWICENQLSSNHAGGIYLAGEVKNGLIGENKIADNEGTSNWMAGIVLTNAVPQDKKNLWETFDEEHHFPHKENLYAQISCPHDLLIRDNQVCGNQASGIYSDGAYSCYVVGNTVRQNDKEGICLDYGTIGFYLKENVFGENGQRSRQTDKDLEMDFVLGAGRMEDGSAKAKLPGVSMDNAAYNILENNIVTGNYGGGIKMVRTAVRNLISENIIRDNNMGQNDVYHFFGIEAGYAAADVESEDMDFAPDFENIICRNSITGNHYSGVFIGADCYVNDVFDNIIMEPGEFAVEAVSTKFNSIVNNISNAGVRNEYEEGTAQGK